VEPYLQVTLDGQTGAVTSGKWTSNALYIATVCMWVYHVYTAVQGIVWDLKSCGMYRTFRHHALLCNQCRSERHVTSKVKFYRRVLKDPIIFTFPVFLALSSYVRNKFSSLIFRVVKYRTFETPVNFLPGRRRPQPWREW